MSAAITPESLQRDLMPSLSRAACLHLPGSQEFAKSNLRFTEYERPVRNTWPTGEFYL